MKTHTSRTRSDSSPTIASRPGLRPRSFTREPATPARSALPERPFATSTPGRDAPDAGAPRRSLAYASSLPPSLRAPLERLAGRRLDSVQVHYNSPNPARVGARAYTQGADIHLAPGREEHLPHEAWHVVQQMQGRVQPTGTIGGVPMNDASSLEREADVMGAQAATGVDLDLDTSAANDAVPSSPGFRPTVPLQAFWERTGKSVVWNSGQLNPDEYEQTGETWWSYNPFWRRPVYKKKPTIPTERSSGASPTEESSRAAPGTDEARPNQGRKPPTGSEETKDSREAPGHDNKKTPPKKTPPPRTAPQKTPPQKTPEDLKAEFLAEMGRMRSIAKWLPEADKARLKVEQVVGRVETIREAKSELDVGTVDTLMASLRKAQKLTSWARAEKLEEEQRRTEEAEERAEAARKRAEIVGRHFETYRRHLQDKVNKEEWARDKAFGGNLNPLSSAYQDEIRARLKTDLHNQPIEPSKTFTGQKKDERVRYYVTESSNTEGIWFDISGHIWNTDGDTRKTVFVLHVPTS